MADMQFYWSSKSMAQLLNLSVQRIGQLTDKGVLKCTMMKGKKAYHFIDSVHDYIDYIKGTSAKDEDAANASKKLAAEAEIKDIARKKAELMLAEYEGQLHKDEDVKEILCELVFEVRAQLDGFRNKAVIDLCDISDPSEMAVKLDGYIDGMLESLSKYQYDPGSKTAKQSRKRRSKELQTSGEVDG